MTGVAARLQLAAPTAAEPTLDSFGKDPWWLILGKVLAIFVFLVLTVLMSMWVERRLIGRMQLRIGPNRCGPFGLLQGLADGIKLALKEDIVPRGVDKVVFVLAPVISAVPAFISFIIIPFGPTVSVFGHQTPLQGTDLPVAVLLVLAMSSMGIYGIVLAGWSSMSPYSLLGGLRSSAQMISYEIAMSLSFVAVFLFAGSMSTTEIVAKQHDVWFAVLLVPSFVIYIVTMMGESNRIPFDLPEGEGELVGGFHTEYSSLKFAMFFLAEYINLATLSALATTMFLGGWRAPAPISTVWPGANEGWWPVLWFLVKIWMFIFFFIWLRGALPRVRYDQLMKLGWKVLMPASLAWIMIVATVRAFRNEGVDTRSVMVYGGFVIAVIIAASLIWDLIMEGVRESRAKRAGADGAGEPGAEAGAGAGAGPGTATGTTAEDAMAEDAAGDAAATGRVSGAAEAGVAAGGFPVPPMDAPHYHGVTTPRKEVPSGLH